MKFFYRTGHKEVGRYLNYHKLPESEKIKIRQEFVDEYKQGAQTRINVNTIDDRQKYFND